EDNAVTIAVLANDSDVDGDSLTISAVTQPAHGAAAINADGTVAYTPAANYNGPDRSAERRGDRHGSTRTATAAVTVAPVNDAPAARDDSAANDEDNAVTIAVLANDSDVDGDSLTISAVTQPAHGAAAINADGTVAYTPAANYNGPD